MTASVWVTHRFPAFHRWPDAPDRRAYLRQLHRHVFHVRVWVDVAHDGREVEFHDLLYAVRLACPVPDTDLGDASCEMIARSIGKKVMRDYPNRLISVEVSEDGESGATVAI